MTKRIFPLLSLLLALLIIPVRAQGTSPASIIAGDPNLSILFEAAVAAGLDGQLTGDITVFAPTNGAFGTLLGELGLTQEQLLADTALLRAVLAYHVVPGTYSAGDVLAAGSVDLPTANGATINATFAENRVRLNGGRAVVIGPNRFGGVGVVHVINNVLLPPGAAPTPPTTTDTDANTPTIAVAAPPPGTVLSLAASNPDLSLFVQAVEAAGLTETLSGPGLFTVFVPTDAAFGTLLNDLALQPDNLLGDQTLLRNVLTYHVVPGRVFYTDMFELGINTLGPEVNGSRVPTGIPNTQTLATVNGAPLPVNIRGDQIILANGQATVSAYDFPAPNGLLHVIDNVMLP